MVEAAVVGRIEVGRRVAADPTSVALLLAETPTTDDPARMWRVTTAPRRIGAVFVAAVELIDRWQTIAAGGVTVGPVTDTGGAGSEIRLVVDLAATDPSADAAPTAREAAAAFVASLAERARFRARAA
jgi:hypothetical protein